MASAYPFEGGRTIAALGARLERCIPSIEQRLDGLASAAERDAPGLLEPQHVEFLLDLPAGPAVDGHPVSLVARVTEVDRGGPAPVGAAKDAALAVAPTPLPAGLSFRLRVSC